jgi:hypothetical protein
MVSDNSAGQSASQYVSAVPQLPQNPRSTLGDDRYSTGRPCVNTTEVFSTV